MRRLGLIVNPLAGLGGSVALGGSDGMAAEAVRRGAIPRAGERAGLALASMALASRTLAGRTLVGIGEETHRPRDGDSERVRRLEVDDETLRLKCISGSRQTGRTRRCLNTSYDQIARNGTLTCLNLSRWLTYPLVLASPATRQPSRLLFS